MNQHLFYLDLCLAYSEKEMVFCQIFIEVGSINMKNFETYYLIQGFLIKLKKATNARIKNNYEKDKKYQFDCYLCNSGYILSTFFFMRKPFYNREDYFSAIRAHWSVEVNN
jgi:hypothetical protein